MYVVLCPPMAMQGKVDIIQDATSSLFVSYIGI